MSKKEGSGGKRNINEGYVPNKRGYQQIKAA